MPDAVMMLKSISMVGRRTIEVIRIVGRSTLFLLESLSYGFVPPFKVGRIVEQVAFIGAKSLTIIVITGAFTGMVLGLQAYDSLRRFGSETLLGSTVALSMVRELGPVLSALMVTGRAGSAMTAELAFMRLTDQLDALEMMSVNPVKFLVTPKIFAGLISLPLLSAIFDVSGICGGFLIGATLFGLDQSLYFGEMARAVELRDIAGGFLKSLLFGLTISWVCSLIGYTAVATTEGVTKATTNSVVTGSVMVLVMDYFLASLLL